MWEQSGIMRAATKRGVSLDDSDDDAILPDAAIFTAPIDEYCQAINKKELYSNFKETMEQAENKEPEDKEPEIVTRSRRRKNNMKKKDKTRVIEVQPAPVFENRVINIADTEELDQSFGSEPEIIISKFAQKKINNMERRINEHREKLKRICASVALNNPAENNYSDDDDDDDNNDIQCLDDASSRTIEFKIRCGTEIFRMSLKMKERFSKIFSDIANKYKVTASEVLLCLNNKTISLEDTPEKIKLNVSDIVDCCIWTPRKDDEVGKRNHIDVKLQSSDTKEKITLTIHKLDPLMDMMQQYSKKRAIELVNLMFEFDGERLLPAQTPHDLDMENDSCIDVTIL